MNGLSITIIVATIIVGILFHEFGHLVAAKICHVKVNKYVLGMGKPVLKHKGKDDVEYGVALIPAGGYCDIDENALNKAPLSHYIFVLSAGVICNMILGTILYVVGVAVFSGGTIPLAEALSQAASGFTGLIASLGTMIKTMFNIREMAEAGGIISSLGSGAAMITESTSGLAQNVGVSILVGAMLNYALAIFNALPIPAIDGGQITIKLICEAVKRFFKKSIPAKIVNALNYSVYIVLMGYQVFIFALDVPIVRDIVLKICS